MKKNILLLSFSLLLAFVIAELCIRWALEIRPGLRYENVDFEMDDTLEITPIYDADSFGITKFSPATVQAVQKVLEELYAMPPIADCNFDSNIQKHQESLRYLIRYNQLYLPQLNWYPCCENPEMQQWINRLKDPSLPMDSTYRAAGLAYIHQGLNDDGFRSIPFVPYTGTAKKKILLVGDSFTYGFSAWPVNYSFFNQMLQSENYLVYNAGITSTDPVQYLQVCKKYVPIIQPDYVIISLFWGNDLCNSRRPIKPYQTNWYCTMDKMIDAAPYGEYLPPREANMVMRLNNIIPNQSTNWFNWLLAQTSTGTLIWRALERKQLIDISEPLLVPYQKNYKDIDELALCEQITTEAVNVCKQGGAKPLVFIIPDLMRTNPFTEPVTYSNAFKNLPFEIPAVNEQWYRPYPDGHFNNYGHAQYARRLLQVVDSLETTSP